MDRLEVRDAASLVAVLAALENFDGWVVAALDYELGYLLEPCSAPPGWTGGEAVLARFWRFTGRAPMDRRAADAWLAARAAGDPAGIGEIAPAIDEAAYCRAVRRIQAWIKAGDCYQVNYTFPLDFSWYGSPSALYARLRERQPVRYGGFVADGSQAILSLSPELFVERRSERLTARPMKGTAPRAQPAASLLHSAKDRAENLMIVDLLRNDLGRIAEKGGVTVDRLFEIEAYPTLWQMVSSISARLPAGTAFGDILRALFPCGSITGAPKIRAMQIAAELEARPRGLYTGSLGWLAPGGDFRLNVAIRTLLLEPGGRGSMGVGSGIVADSDPAAEWAECAVKSRFLHGPDAALRLIETLRRENGHYPHLAGHLARLRDSARRLGFVLDEAAARRRLEDLPVAGLQRVRLLLAADGEIAVEAFPLAAEPPGPRSALLAGERIAAADPLRRHKTTHRPLYDAALHRLAGRPAYFDMVFLNERGEVAEGARSNVFVEREGILLTPPVASGALPGVLRAALIGAGRARESVLYPDDLRGGFRLGNALRGLIDIVGLEVETD